jgi:hypothetical protein
MPEPGPVERLIEDGYLRHEDARLRTTARWQAALARAALLLQRADAPWSDLRLPIAAALAGRYDALDDDALAVLVEVMLSVEQAELAPMLGPPAPGAET